MNRTANLRWLLLIAIATFLLPAISSLRSLAADTVTVATAEGRDEKRIGEIIDYTGTSLTLRVAGGRETAIPAKDVRGFETTRLPEHDQGDLLFIQGKFAEALEQYRACGSKEPRRWVQRELLAGMARAYFELGNIEKAAASFVVLVRSDPETPHFDAIPLCWRTSEPPPTLLKLAGEWLTAKESPVAQLMGASWLLATDRRTECVAALQKLKESENRRVAMLAEAQLWRTRFVAATPAEVARWRKTIADMPRELRAGPFFVLGQAEARLDLPEAAISFLRVPVLYNYQRTLAAEALFAAGQVLVKGKHPEEAYRAYAELAGRFPQSPLAETAKERCATLQNELAEKGGIVTDDNLAATPPAESAEPGDPTDGTLITGLMDRRQYSLAHRLCIANLASTDVNAAARESWQLKRIAVETALASDAAPAQQEAHWKTVLANAASLSERDQVSTDAVAAHVELAGIHLARGEQLAHEAEFLMGDEKRFDAARAELQFAHKLLNQAAAELKRLQSIAAQKKIQAAYAERLLSVQNRIAIALARTLRLEALSLPSGGARIDGLAHAQKQLQPLLELDVADASYWPCRLEMLACARALEKFDSARQLRAVLAESNPSPETATRLRTEQVRLELAAGRLDVAKEIVRDDQPLPYSLPTEAQAELDFARLEVLVACRKEALAAGQGDDAESLSKEALALVSPLRLRYGAGWARRADLLLGK